MNEEPEVGREYAIYYYDREEDVFFSKFFTYYKTTSPWKTRCWQNSLAMCSITIALGWKYVDISKDKLRERLEELHHEHAEWLDEIAEKNRNPL